MMLPSYLMGRIFIASHIHLLTYPPASCSDGDLRLFGGVTNNEGTLEMCLDQRWGTVCDDLFDNSDAKVACRKLGYQAEGRVS